MMLAALRDDYLPEPSGLGNELLLDWAPWARDDNDGEGSWSVKPRVDPGYHGDPPERWYVVNRIVSKLLHNEREFREVVKPYYLGERAYSDIAKSIGRTELGVRVTLCHVCWLVEREYIDILGSRR